MIRYIAIITILLSGLVSFAQESIPFKAFVKGHKLDWVKSFNGEMGNAKVKLSLGYDGYLCKGEMTYLKSNLIVNLDGTIKNDSLKLIEYSKDGKLQGVITGIINKNTISGDWISKDGEHLVYFLAKKPSGVLDNNISNSWVKFYEGTANSKNKHLILTKKSNDDISVLTWNNKSRHLTYLEGKSNESSYELLDVTNNSKVVGRENGKKFQIVAKDKNGELVYSNFELSETIPLRSKSFTNQSTSYEFIFPITQDKKLNQVIQNKIEPWLENCRKKVQGNLEKKLVDNHKNRGFSWLELTYLDENIFSGTFYFRSTWTNVIETKTINYSFTHKQVISKKEIFKKRAKYDLFIQKHLDVKLSQIKKDDKSFQQWLKHASFKHFTFGKEYLFVSTEMSRLYGKETIMISYKEISDLLKRKNWVKPL